MILHRAGHSTLKATGIAVTNPDGKQHELYQKLCLDPTVQFIPVNLLLLKKNVLIHSSRLFPGLPSGIYFLTRKLLSYNSEFRRCINEMSPVGSVVNKLNAIYSAIHFLENLHLGCQFVCPSYEFCEKIVYEFLLRPFHTTFSAHFIFHVLMTLRN